MLGVRTTVALPLLVAIAAWSGTAQATDCHPANGLSTCIDSDNLWVHPGGGPFLSIGSVATAPADELSFGFVVSYLSRPIGLRISSPDPSGTVVRVIDNAFDATFAWTLGITDRLELTVAAPVTMYQTGGGLADVEGSSTELVRSAIRDARFGLAFALIPRARVGVAGGTALTARFEFAAPTGDSSSFAGSGAVTGFPTLVLDHRFARLELAAEVGARIRPARSLAGTAIGTQLSGALGATFDVIPRDRLLTIGAEAFALYSLPVAIPSGPGVGQPAGNPAPAEWMATVSSAPLLAGDVTLLVGGGGAIPLTSESSLTTPRFRFDFGLRYAPLGRDLDGDGVLDRNDKCREKPEDKDGFEDADGCPDPDNDKDGIPDERDRCRDAPEDFDGFEDTDGCPDDDDDKDGLADNDDKCRSAPEDKDGFEDADGCPDLDNDKDGIADTRDRCPMQAEDKDGFQDADGCPELDDDNDGIPDAKDRCPRQAEDKDGFQDVDGCPDPDNDSDGVLDAQDRCPAAAETINGDADEDGCPEPGAHSIVSWDGDRVVFAKPHRFDEGKSKLSADLKKDVRMAATLARTRSPIEAIIVEGYGDRSGDESPKAVALAVSRAEAAKAELVAAGIPAEKITPAAGDLASKRAPSAASLDISVRGANPAREPNAKKRAP